MSGTEKFLDRFYPNCDTWDSLEYQSIVHVKFAEFLTSLKTVNGQNLDSHYCMSLIYIEYYDENFESLIGYNSKLP